MSLAAAGMMLLLHDLGASTFNPPTLQIAVEPLAPATDASSPPPLQPSGQEVSPVTTASAPPALDDIPPSALADSQTEQRAPAEEIVVIARPRHAAGDPLQAVNAQSFALTQTVDKAVVAPVALTYQRALPAPVRDAIRNFFNNLAEPVSFLNFVLQLKPGKAVGTAGRFIVNTTVGVAGILDLAKKRPFKLPRRPNGFANTLGYYGVKPGPFLFLPLIGPTTIRDLIGLSIDRMVLPTAIGQPFNQPSYTVPASIVGSLDYRVEFDAQLHKLRNAPDPYVASRAHYLAARQAEIDALHGRRAAAPVERRILPVLP